MPKMGRREIIADVKSKIESGEWPAGFTLPSTDELAAYYECAKATIDTAMQILNAERVIVSVAGGRRRVRDVEESTGELSRSDVEQDMRRGGDEEPT